MITNEEFLRTLFGEDYVWAHVCSFTDDPSEIPGERRFQCWGGNYYSRAPLIPNSNQYFTISTFYADDKGKARRRKALFRATHVIVADDVREKLPLEQVLRLPPPTYKLETSPGSEQWGWVLTTPATDRHRVENLLDGLVRQGLAPDGKDPGMRGVTRYVRLPEGVNTKASRVVANGGVAPPCRILEWSPTRKTSLAALAAPFAVDLGVERREQRIDGAASVDGHPLLDLDLIEIKSVRSDGRFDITCPWVDEHTGGKDDGAAIFTNGDGSIGFKCHHGSCQSRTGGDLLMLIEKDAPGFRSRLDMWKVMRIFGSSAPAVQPKLPPLDFMGKPVAPRLDFMGDVPVVDAPPPGVSDKAWQTDKELRGYYDRLKLMIPGEMETHAFAEHMLQIIKTLRISHRTRWIGLMKDVTGWTKAEINKMMDEKDDDGKLAEEDEELSNFYATHVFVAEQNMFYCPGKRMWLSPESFHNYFSHVHEDARTRALTGKKGVNKVDRFDYAPGLPEIFTEGGITYVNGWSGSIDCGVQGDASRWLQHFDLLGWSEHKKHILQWMAYTLRHPENKINHILLLAGGEGNGKDFLLHPLHQAMARDATTIDGDELLRDFNDYLLSTKYLHINETELGDRKEARVIANKLKPLASSPPYRLRVNPKGVKPILVRNVVNCTMTSNSAMPLSLSGDSRRYYAAWSSISIRGADGQMTAEWRAYWDDRWRWMRCEDGWRACVHYLMHEVDLSDFDPGAVPVVTEFVKEIQEASEDPLHLVMREMIDNKQSLFASDIVCSRDVVQALKAAALLGHDIRYMPPASAVGRIMKQSGLGVSRWARHDNGNDMRLWIVRNRETYAKMNSSEVYQSYVRLMGQVRQTSPLTVVRREEKLG